LYVIDTAGPGNIIGLPAALQGTHRVTARTVEASQFGYITVNVLEHLLDSYPEICRDVMESISMQIRRTGSTIGKSDTARAGRPNA
jgi:CRP-like cAMP-binding protein